VVLHTDSEPVESSVEQVLAYLEHHGLTVAGQPGRVGPDGGRRSATTLR
jgi:hypothetical protein